MPLSDDDAKRFESLKDAIADTYATGPMQPRRRRPRYSRKIFALAVAGCVLVVVALAGAMFAQWRAAMQVRSEVQSQALPPVALATAPPVTIPPYTPPPHTPRPHTPPPATPAPTEPPTQAPSATPSPGPTATATSNAPPVIHNAFLLVKSNGQLKVGARGSCGGLDRTVEVRGYPKGCTVFDADSSGPLANGRGTALVVPVSTTEDVANVTFGLLYIRTSDADEPHFVGLIRSRGAGRVVVRVERGLIVAQTDDDVTYYTFDGRRIVRGPE